MAYDGVTMASRALLNVVPAKDSLDRLDTLKTLRQRKKRRRAA